MSLSKSHQTAVFFRTNPNASAKHRERAARAAESFNQPGSSPVGTIKADLYSVFPDGQAYRGLVWGDEWDLDSVGFVGVSSPDMRRAAKDAGYALTVVVDTTETEVDDYTQVDVSDYEDDDEDDDEIVGYNDEFNPFTVNEPGADVSDEALSRLLYDVLFPAPVETPAAGVVINVENLYIALPNTAG